MDRFFTLFVPLAWPLATLVIALVFRKDLGQAMGRVGQFKYRDLELNFRENLQQAEQLARSFPPPAAKGAVVLEAATEETEPLGGRLIVSPAAPGASPERLDSPSEAAGRGPREAVEAAWGVVAHALAARKGRPTGPEAALVGLLRSLRDRAARLDQAAPSPEDADRFVALAHRVASRL